MYDVRMSKTHVALILSALILIGSTSYTISSWGVQTQRTPQIVQTVQVGPTTVPVPDSSSAPATTHSDNPTSVEKEEREDD